MTRRSAARWVYHPGIERDDIAQDVALMVVKLFAKRGGSVRKLKSLSSDDRRRYFSGIVRKMTIGAVRRALRSPAALSLEMTAEPFSDCKEIVLRSELLTAMQKLARKGRSVDASVLDQILAVAVERELPLAELPKLVARRKSGKGRVSERTASRRRTEGKRALQEYFEP